MLPKNKIDDLIEKHSLLEKQLSSGDIDKKKFAEKSKEYSDLNEVINEAKKYQKYDKEKVELLEFNIVKERETWEDVCKFWNL